MRHNHPRLIELAALAREAATLITEVGFAILEPNDLRGVERSGRHVAQRLRDLAETPEVSE